MNNAQDGDVVALSGELNLANVTINKDVTFISYDGSAVIDQTTFNIASDVNISFQNITFANAENDTDKSLVYAQKYSADLVFEGCVFEHTAYECVQITPINGSNVTVNNCTFKVDESDNDSCSEAGVHRLLHIQNTSKGTVTSKITVINNTFIGCDRCHNAVIDVDFIEAENFVAGNNKFYKADGTEITTNSQMQELFADDNAIWCCNGYEFVSGHYSQHEYTFDFFTGPVQSYEDFAK